MVNGRGSIAALAPDQQHQGGRSSMNNTYTLSLNHLGPEMQNMFLFSVYLIGEVTEKNVIDILNVIQCMTYT